MNVISKEKLDALVKNYITTKEIKDAREMLEPMTPVLFVGIGSDGKREEIRGVVDKTYRRVFTLTDGRSFTYVDYILGTRFGP